MNQVSLRASPGGSTALLCHCNMRCVLVKVPSFSPCPAAGKRNTSVPIFSGLSSPRSTSGESYQNEAVSVSTMSRTTSHFNLASALRSNRPLGAPTAGFWPMTNKPSTLPSIISSQYPKCEWSPVTRGSQSKPQSLPSCAASPYQALSRLIMYLSKFAHSPTLLLCLLTYCWKRCESDSK